MHLGQTAAFIAEVFNRPEASVLVVSRLLREGGWITKGPRGRNAPHLSADELAVFLLAVMCSPDSPATGMSRLPHFHQLRKEDDETGQQTLGKTLALLLSRIASETNDQARKKGWTISVSIDMSMAMVTELFPQPDGEESKQKVHHFSSLVGADPDTPIKEAMPFYGGLEFRVTLPWFTLLRIAKVVIANEPDPLTALAARVEA